MGFLVWHYLARVAFPLLFLLSLLAFALPGSRAVNLVGGVSGIGMVVLGLTGAVLAVRLLFMGFRFACPRCQGRDTAFGMSPKKAMWLHCEKCGLFEESGLLKLKVALNEDVGETEAD